jgi:kynurenine formamidase
MSSSRGSKVIDLTHTLDESTLCWPGDRPFRRRDEARGTTSGAYWYALGSFEMSEHSGTHMDAPIHFADGRQAIDEIPPERFLSPAVVIDISRACARDQDYQLSREDIARWEAAHGAIPPGAAALAQTGWAERWRDPGRYLGSASLDDAGSFHFPGISQAAVEQLLERRVHAVGIDTASLDHGPSTTFQTHRILNAAGVYGLENLANLHLLPACGATLIALPVKIRGGSGAPARGIAIGP